MKNLFATCALMFTLVGSAFGVEQKLVTITSDIDKNKTDFFIEVKEDGSIDSLRFITTMPNGGIFEDFTHPSETVINEGIVIVKQQGRKVLKLFVENFTVTDGGIVKLDYLWNGVDNSRKSMKIKLGKIDGKFAPMSLDGKPIKSMFIVGNRTVILGVVGIREIRLKF